MADAVPAGGPGTYLSADWNTYIEVEEADAAAEAVSRAGGEVEVPPLARVPAAG